MNDERYTPDRGEVRRAFDAAAETYDEAAVLQHEVGRRLIERFELINLQPRRILDLGAGTGLTTRALMRAFPKAEILVLDLAPGMLHRARHRGRLRRKLPAVCAEAEALPLVENSFDLVFSNLTLQWCPDLDTVFQEVQRVIRTEGLFMFSSFGPDTLHELRESWSAADGYSHVNAFIDMHDVGDALGRCGFADPVMDNEHFTLTYADVRRLMDDLRAIGAHNVTAGRARGLTSPRRLKAMREHYEGYRDAEGRLPATYEVVYGHAWSTDVLPQRQLEPGVVGVPVSGIRRRGE